MSRKKRSTSSKKTKARAQAFEKCDGNKVRPRSKLAAAEKKKQRRQQQAKAEHRDSKQQAEHRSAQEQGAREKSSQLPQDLRLKERNCAAVANVRVRAKQQQQENEDITQMFGAKHAHKNGA